ncbi:hypothetical protein D9M73_240510 [compost metagenome]
MQRLRHPEANQQEHRHQADRSDQQLCARITPETHKPRMLDQQQGLEQRTETGKGNHQRPEAGSHLFHQQRRQTYAVQRRQHDEVQQPEAANPKGLGQLPGDGASPEG